MGGGRVSDSLFSEGGEWSPPLGGGHEGGDSLDQGGELRVSYMRRIIALYFLKRSIFKNIILSSQIKKLSYEVDIVHIALNS